MHPTGVLPAVFSTYDAWKYRLVTRIYAFGMLCHLWLGDAWTDGWEIPNALAALGLILLSVNPCFAGWFLCFAGKLIPLLFLRDQLTQSVVLMSYAAIGMVFHVQLALGRGQVGHFYRGLQSITALTYTLATFHKLNSEFLNPVTSCANYGMHELFVHWSLPTEWSEWVIWPGVALLSEGAIPVLLSLGRHRLAWVLVAFFHIPLTITMAPAFAFVMFAGHAAFATDADREAFDAWVKRSAIWIIPISVGITALSVLNAKITPDFTMIVREWMLWALAAGSLVHLFKSGAHREERPRQGNWAIRAIVMLFLLNGLTPYTGVQMQHAGAMLSNLRIDEGCWNHVIIPESFRLTEDYIRIEDGYFGKPGRVEEYEKIMKDQLWNGPQIRQMRRNWCSDSLRPFYMRGTLRGEPFEIADLCSDEDLPFGRDGFFGVEIFPEFLRFQKNLERECPQACIH